MKTLREVSPSYITSLDQQKVFQTNLQNPANLVFLWKIYFIKLSALLPNFYFWKTDNSLEFFFLNIDSLKFLILSYSTTSDITCTCQFRLSQSTSDSLVMREAMQKEEGASKYFLTDCSYSFYSGSFLEKNSNEKT